VQHHPFTEYWPLLSGENFERFKADVAANGLRMPILTYQDQVLDGRNRERACEETGVPARYEDCGARSDEDALMLVVSLNEHRRHLSEDERLFAAARLANLPRGGDRTSKLSKESLLSPKVITLEKAAKLMDVSFGSSTRARTILKHGTKEDEQDVLSGKISLTKKEAQVRSRSHKVSRLPTKKKIMITIPYEDVIEKLRPLVKRVKEQSKRHAATVSFTELSIIAHELGELADAWMKSGLESGTRSEPAPFNRVRGG
jgi:hypothetical protein